MSYFKKYHFMKQVQVKDFPGFIEGKEVEATASIHHNSLITAGETVLAFKDSLAANTNIPVPKKLQDLAIGIEGTVMETEHPESGRQKLRIKKI
jgi:hypothetical protein